MGLAVSGSAQVAFGGGRHGGGGGESRLALGKCKGGAVVRVGVGKLRLALGERSGGAVVKVGIEEIGAGGSGSHRRHDAVRIATMVGVVSSVSTAVAVVVVAIVETGTTVAMISTGGGQWGSSSPIWAAWQASPAARHLPPRDGRRHCHRSECLGAERSSFFEASLDIWRLAT